MKEPDKCPACEFEPGPGWAPPLNYGDVFDEYGACRNCEVVWWRQEIERLRYALAFTGVLLGHPLRQNNRYKGMTQVHPP